MEINKKAPARLGRGFSLIEMLVVLSVFAILTVVMTQILFVTVRSAKKSDATVRVRQNLENALTSMERQLHNAVDIPVCPNPDTSTVTLEDINGQQTNFACVNIGSNGYIASNSARLTSNSVIVTSCSLTCTGGAGTPTSVAINVTAVDANTSGSENVSISIMDRVLLRSH
jgi:prepilin-type N-terminal cleavage/methylation domain-containing protein